MAPVLQPFFPANMGIMFSVALYFMLFLLNMMIESSFLFIHISSYVITHYIKLLFPLNHEEKRDADDIASRNKYVLSLQCKICSIQKKMNFINLPFDMACIQDGKH